LPNLIIVGVSRAGTTSLFNYLGQHPDVCTSDVKELRFFAPLRYGRSLGAIDTYAAHFRGCRGEAYAMEATPGYFYGGYPLAHGIRQVCPEARALVSLREPIDRCWSWFNFGKSRVRIPEDMTFSDYLDRCEELHVAGVDGDLEHQPYWGLGGGCYALWLEAWLQEFGDRFRILFFDDLVADPRGSVRSICAWLGIDDSVSDTFRFSTENKAVPYNNRVLQKSAVSLNRRGERFFHRHPELKRALRDAYYRVNQKGALQPGMSAPERARLAEFYRPHNSRLSAQLAASGLSVPSSWSRAT
jgi:hypothetical protein